MSWREPKTMWIRRLRMAFRFRMWPWDILGSTARHLALDQRLTDKEMARAQEFARTFEKRKK